MKRAIGLFLFFAALVGAIAATHAMVIETVPPGLTCAGERVVSYGWTDERESMAELAAIAKWQKEAEQYKPGFGQWHQAFGRSLSCREFRGSSHFQCQVSARPCRYEDG